MSQAQPVVGGRIGGRKTGLGQLPDPAPAFEDRPRADGGEPRIRIDDAPRQGPRRAGLVRQLEGRQRPIANQRYHQEVLAAVGDLDLGAQPIEPQAPHQVVAPRRLAIEHQHAVPLDHEQVVQELALGGQEGGVDGPVRRHLMHVVGNEALQEATGVRPVERQQAASVQHHMGLVAGLAPHPRHPRIEVLKASSFEPAARRPQGARLGNRRHADV